MYYLKNPQSWHLAYVSYKCADHSCGRRLRQWVQVDVVVAPSIWYENAPLVIREAFLAGKPVVTAAFGGMQEWVRDGINGLLFRPRDVLDLRRTLERFIVDLDFVRRLSNNFPAVQSISADAYALEERYGELIRQRS
jgi:glycosyltransferase involved in cell wall biosynthesis